MARISLLIITIAFTPISFFIFSSCFPYKTERIDTYNVLLEQKDNEYIVMCENEYVKNATIKILPLNENIYSIYHFINIWHFVYLSKRALGLFFIFEIILPDCKFLSY